MKYVTESLADALYQRRLNESAYESGTLINEATSAVSSKLNDFIKGMDAKSQADVKKTLNRIYLWIKEKGMTYEEDGKATKGQLKDLFNKYGSSTMDQLTWRLKVFCPDTIYPKFKVQSNFTAELEKTVQKDANNYTVSCTSSDYFYTNYLDDKSSSVGVAIKGMRYVSTGTTGYYIILFFKVTAPHIEAEKPVANNDANHKKIETSVKGFVKDADAKKKITKALDTIYTQLGNYVDGKKVMDKEGTIKYKNTDENNFATYMKVNGKSSVDMDAIMWKIEVLDDKYELKEVMRNTPVLLPKLIKFKGSPIYAFINGDDYSGVMLEDSDYGIALSYDYGSRHTEYVKIVILRLRSMDANTDYSKINPCSNEDGTRLYNKTCAVSFDKDRMSISGADLTDMMNEPRFYTEKKKGVADAWQNLMREFNQDTTFSGAMGIIDKTCNTRMYYAMD